MEHILKTWPEPFLAIRSGVKKFEFRKNDRDFKVGDTLRLRLWIPPHEGCPDGMYMDETICVEVTYILYSGFGIPEGYCIMSIKDEYESI